MWDLLNESMRDRFEDMERKYNQISGEETQSACTETPRCSCCSSKIYHGDTVYYVDRFVYCAECGAESEYYA
jgi:hypothetical protein